MRKFKILKNKDMLMSEFSPEGVTETLYRPYQIGDLPKEFGCIKYEHNGKVKVGMSNWLKINGLTYVKIEQ
tara:strand:- start:402 stop:614 length:213 start_codon:yes stop_codon:yes gene_type:complete